MRKMVLVGGWAVALAATTLSAAEIRDDGKHVICSEGKREIFRYRHGGELVKPFVAELRTPAGVNILRDSPSDHKHHHALMFAVAAEGVNFWEEVGPFGREVGRDLTLLTSDQPGLRQKIEWIGPAASDSLLEETRVLQLNDAAKDPATLLTWQCELRAPAGKPSVKITGAPYFGLGMRFLESMDDGGKFLNADGKTGVKDTNAGRSAWCAYSAKAEGQPVTVAVFDHPRNQRHPATWFTMEDPFAYLAVTLNLKDEPMTIERDKPLLLRYAVALWDGTPSAAEIDDLYRRWSAR